MSETYSIKYYSGVVTMPQMVVRARDRASDVVQQMASYGYRVEIVNVLPQGTMAETGYYATNGDWNGLGAWLEPERRPSLWARLASLLGGKRT